MRTIRFSSRVRLSDGFYWPDPKGLREAMATVKDAVLGLVVERPGYGYELAKRLEGLTPGFHWNGSQIYAALSDLEAKDYVRTIGERKGTRDSKRAAPRTVYEATPEGVRAFEEWMFAPSPPVPVRQDLDLKLQLATTPEHWRELIEQAWAQEVFCLAELRSLMRAARVQQTLPSSPWAHASAMLQRNGEIKMLQARVQWLQEARRVLGLMLKS